MENQFLFTCSRFFCCCRRVKNARNEVKLLSHAALHNVHIPHSTQSNQAISCMQLWIRSRSKPRDGFHNVVDKDLIKTANSKLANRIFLERWYTETCSAIHPSIYALHVAKKGFVRDIFDLSWNFSLFPSLVLFSQCTRENCSKRFFGIDISHRWYRIINTINWGKWFVWVNFDLWINLFNARHQSFTNEVIFKWISFKAARISNRNTVQYLRTRLVCLSCICHQLTLQRWKEGREGTICH